MFCSKCGNKVSEDALFCSRCGYNIASHHSSASAQTAYSQDYIALKAFEEKVNSIYIVSVVALVLLFGIGLIFSVVVWIKAKSTFIPNVTTTNPYEVAMFESLKRKLKKALAFSNAPMYVVMIVLVPALAFAQMYGAVLLVFAAYLLLLFLVGIPFTRHLQQELNKKN